MIPRRRPDARRKILVTGGTGYVGAHTCVALTEAGMQPVILDNLSKSRASVVDRIEGLTGVRPPFVRADVADEQALETIFATHDIEAVIHLAGLKAVAESVVRPLEYFENNVRGSIALLAAMRRADVKTFVFSSSATVYGQPASLPVREDSPRNAVSPYGRSKLIVEDMLHDLSRAEPDWGIACLRYFNPVGAHESGLIGEDARDAPNNLFPHIAEVAAGRRKALLVHGHDYPTRDGTGVRDYIHVCDVAAGHLAAMDYLLSKAGMLTINLGTGKGYSVLEVLRAFELAVGRPIPYELAARRPGDVAEYYADPALAGRLLNWRATRSLDEMCEDAWRWRLRNPDGYQR